MAIALKGRGDRGALLTIAAVTAIATCLAIGKTLRRTKWALVLNAREVLLRYDPTRRPVLLLRAFTDDEMVVGVTDQSLFGKSEVTFEEIITQEFAKVGPVIAIGRPGERSPPPGAARLWLRDDAWQNAVDLLLEECQSVIMIVGAVHRHPGLAWEVRTTHA